MKKLIVWITVSLFACSPAYAEPVVGVFLPEDSVNKVLTDRRLAEVTIQKLEDCDKGTTELQKQIALEVKNTGLYKQNWEVCDVAGKEKDKALQEVEKIARDRQEAVEDCEKGRPSRMTWFGLGLLSAVLAGAGLSKATK